MADSKFKALFDDITQAAFYVGIFRQKDIRLFNFFAAQDPTGMVGISNLVNYIEIENSIDFSFRVGRIGLRDNIDARKILPLVGNEILYIDYNNGLEYKSSVQFKKSGFFRIMSVEDNPTFQQKNSGMKDKDRELVLTIAEYPYVDILTFTKSHKTYPWGGGNIFFKPFGAKPISLIVQDMFTDVLDQNSITKMGLTLFSFPTADVLPWNWINYYSPSWSKLKNINFLKQYATSLVGGHSYYYLNCEANKVVFSSVYMEFLSPLRLFQTVTFTPNQDANTFPFNIEPSNVANILMDVKYKLGNGLGALYGGYAGETTSLFDYYSGHVFSAYDYRLFKLLTSSNDLFYINYQKLGNQESSMSQSSFTEPFLIENFKKYQFAKRSFNSMICEATTFISASRYLGQTANIQIDSIGAASNDIIDPIFGENWCIWGYKDIISNGRGITKLTLKKDSTYVPFFGVFGEMFNLS